MVSDSQREPDAFVFGEVNLKIRLCHFGTTPISTLLMIMDNLGCWKVINFYLISFLIMNSPTFTLHVSAFWKRIPDAFDTFSLLQELHFQNLSQNFVQVLVSANIILHNLQHSVSPRQDKLTVSPNDITNKTTQILKKKKDMLMVIGHVMARGAGSSTPFPSCETLQIHDILASCFFMVVPNSVDLDFSQLDSRMVSHLSYLSIFSMSVLPFNQTANIFSRNAHNFNVFKEVSKEKKNLRNQRLPVKKTILKLKKYSSELTSWVETTKYPIIGVNSMGNGFWNCVMENLLQDEVEDWISLLADYECYVRNLRFFIPTTILFSFQMPKTQKKNPSTELKGCIVALAEAGMTPTAITERLRRQDQLSWESLNSYQSSARSLSAQNILEEHPLRSFQTKLKDQNDSKEEEEKMEKQEKTNNKSTTQLSEATLEAINQQERIEILRLATVSDIEEQTDCRDFSLLSVRQMEI
ncbi:hypothetical protein VP01_68g5 [Puccinia sorghi]|uniref:Uncharacterized protein n=1 Tax=Puccinia sorghi TaxID=27349 RepID=A0A0L6UE83_9BASI|nr:hypothetical protein VP01_68g5 [Puccinia sorghi]